MTVTFDLKFVKDISLLPEYIHESFAEVYKLCEECQSVREIHNCEKMKGNKNLYRIRIGDYRATFKLKDVNSIVFRRFLSRGQVYKKHVN